VELLLDPVTLLPLLDRLFWLLALLGVGWLALFVFRSISTRAGPFLKPFQTLLGWSVAAVALVWATLLLNFASWWAYHIMGWATP
jgi:hypothetical protein